MWLSSGCKFLVILLSVLTVSCAPKENANTIDRITTGDLRVIDLTYSLNELNAYWPGPGYSPFQLETIATIEEDGVLSKTFAMPEHLGTHLDAPNHFVKGQLPVDEIPLQQLFGPAVVIDVTQKVKENETYQLSLDDIKDWERRHGPIPTGAIVFMYTGWGQRWNDRERYKNTDTDGRLHFPGFSEEAVEFLVTERNIHGLGTDTLSVDYGLSTDFIVHHIAHGAGKYHLENVANLDQLPATGARVIVAPIKIEGGTGGPARIFAILPSSF